MDELSQARLKELLHYDPDTGVFTHLYARRGVTVGNVAGTKGRYGYWFLVLLHRKYLAHRVAWCYLHGAFPPDQIDHINRIRDDNRECNLRCVTLAQNRQNLGVSGRNKSGYRGVSYDKVNDLWRASISVGGKARNLGRYKTKSEAATAYKQAAVKLHTHGAFNV
jgi:hypothetical protein